MSSWGRVKRACAPRGGCTSGGNYTRVFGFGFSSVAVAADDDYLELLPQLDGSVTVATATIDRTPYVLSLLSPLSVSPLPFARPDGLRVPEDTNNRLDASRDSDRIELTKSAISKCRRHRTTL